MYYTIKFIVLFLFLSLRPVLAQENKAFKIHSHNDYLQSAPFWSAYANGANSIEVDVFYKNNILYATHSEADIIEGQTIENLYLQPLEKAYSLQLGAKQELQLLIDIKSEPYSSLKKIISVLKKYPKIIKNPAIQIVISGNRPKVEDYTKYPDYIKFDYQSLDHKPTAEIWDKVAMVSLSFKSLSPWNGKGRLTMEDLESVKNTIEKAHSFGKPFRFWGTPDSKTAWKAFLDLGVDYINTDKPELASIYFNSLEDRVFVNTLHSAVYKPTYESDQKEIPVKNVILMIGDGNGLSHISAAVLANGGETSLTQLKSIGFLKTSASDDFTTDSAAAGTALATGQKTYNRAIGMGTDRKPITNITEFLDRQQFLSGCITTDEIVGATPAGFYAHQLDRDHTQGIASDLLKSKLSLFIGGGSAYFDQNLKINGFSIVNSLEEIGGSEKDKIGMFFSERGVPSYLNGRGNQLAEATRNGLRFLKGKEKPFFLMVESAQIDSYAHANKVAGIVTEGIDFDIAISEAIAFADRSGNTLVIVTADHETGGFTIPQGNIENGMIEGDFTTYDHTGAMVPIFAYGPYSQEFQGVYENSEVYHKILKVLNLNK
ncbi:alkaline phosphatase [Arenibacter nanhaiticus]|uniref:Alkaline phosphatase n=1 Tax=Arenibacter nanhaiticus TaxID=558155 RepID=A0A1M6FT75_9FLAO|nr:alkaline phosphatase [Arenibacter nanhaiticus]SHJ00885.1 alkaline phosphatase [Arenibacter nanhaiticus]